jgi:hypothetical protein
MDRLLRWLAVDGYGFHQGYFYPRHYIENGSAPNVPAGYARCAFDQGLGRSLWFVHGGDVEAIARTIGRFSAERRAHLWSGTGLAAGYAGGVGLTELERLREHAGAHRPSLAQGVAFAAKARARAGNPARHTELACQVVWGASASTAADITDDALQGLPASTAIEPYEAWRSRIRDRFSAVAEVVS